MTTSSLPSKQPSSPSPLAAQERLRQQYLAAMGVTSWLPRQTLPGAAPSPKWQWVDAGTAEAESLLSSASGASPTSTTAVSGVSQARSALAGLMSKPSQSAGAKKSSSSSVSVPQASVQTLPDSTSATQSQASSLADTGLPRPKTEPVSDVATHPAVQATASLTRKLSVRAGEMPRFRLALVAFQHCLVVTELPLRHSQPWSGDHQTLLYAIVAAVGLDGARQGTPNYREFHWPLDPAAAFDQSEAVARHALEVELAEVRSPGQRALLLMGASAAQYLLPLDHSVEPAVLLGNEQQQILCCHGLNEVLRLPGHKAELWRQLQPLRQFTATLSLAEPKAEAGDDNADSNVAAATSPSGNPRD